MLMITNTIHQRPFGKHFMIVRMSQSRLLVRVLKGLYFCFVAMVTFLASTSAHAHQLLVFFWMTVWTF